jgi:polyprenyl-phospho-N-acetylgalactosaminyl synthase
MKDTEFKKKVYIVIAAYNEGTSIGNVIASLQKEKYIEIIVVDDGSKDDTSQKAKGAHVLRHIINRGQGAALQTGITYALSLGAEYIVTFDADGQHDPKEIVTLVTPLLNNEADVCLGSRFLNTHSNVPLLRGLLLKAGVLLMFIMYGIRLTDSHNGFRSFTRKAAKKIEITADRMEHASEILDEIMRNTLKYKEIPVTITYTTYSLQRGQSSWNALNIAYKMIRNKLWR